MNLNPHNYHSSDFFLTNVNLFYSYYLIWIGDLQSYHLSHEPTIESYYQFKESIKDCALLSSITFLCFNYIRSSFCIVWNCFEEFWELFVVRKSGRMILFWTPINYGHQSNGFYSFKQIMPILSEFHGTLGLLQNYQIYWWLWFHFCSDSWQLMVITV